ncbi:hypothetical protein [Alcaligenes faecalis]|uniref:hypothetical protein n=1 Tax=Alcaligenes faecalis TaxID=511 RepID=UPI0034D49C3C
MMATDNPTEECQDLFDYYISVAVDGLDKLQMCDVDRVLEQAQNVDELCLLSEYMLARRKDFDVAEIIELEAQIMAERGWMSKPRRRQQ